MSTFWKDKNVLVTGGSGFIGSYVVEELVKAGSHVTILLSPKTPLKKVKMNLLSVFDQIKVKRADLLSQRSAIAAAKGTDVILHFAALDGGRNFKIQNAPLLYKVNSEMGINILESAKKNGVQRLLIISSIEIYPKNVESPITEDQAALEKDSILNEGYPGAKRFIEREAQRYYRDFDIPIAIARLGNTYGPRDHIDEEKRRVIPTFIAQARNNENITLWGDGSQEVSFIHAADLAPNLLKLVERYAVGDPVNLVSSQYISLKELSQEIIQLTKSKSKITYIKDAPIIKKERKFSSEKAQQKIKFREKISLKKGLKQTIQSL